MWIAVKMSDDQFNPRLSFPWSKGIYFHQRLALYLWVVLDDRVSSQLNILSKFWALPTILLKGLNKFLITTISHCWKISIPLWNKCYNVHFLSKISHILFIIVYISSVVLWTVFVLSSKSLSPTFLTFECQQENKYTWRLFAATERTLMVIRSGKFVDERPSLSKAKVKSWLPQI
jgi:hypothetical protein